MPRRRSTLLLLIALAALLAGAIATRRYITAPPRIACLLPEADAIVYADLRPLRLATHFDRSTPTRSPEYQQFVDATGIIPERDLDQAAFALTRRPDPTGPNGPVAFSEILTIRFEPSRLEPYLARLASSREIYAGHTIYTLPTGSPGSSIPRELRITLLDHNLLAASNASTAEQIHAIIDRHRAGPFTTVTPALLAARFPEVPHLASAWAIGRVGLPFITPSDPPGPVNLLGFDLPFPADQEFIASVRYLGDLRLRIEAIALTPDAATRQTGALTSLLGLVRTLGSAAPSSLAAPAPALTALLNSITLTQIGDRTVITATVPVETLRQLTTTGPAPN